MAKILIIEDDSNLRRGMNLRLRANGYETALAEDGISAVSVARTERPDLALVDIGLPGGDGFSVMRRLQNLASTAGMPMIVITGRDPLTAWPNAEALGVTEGAQPGNSRSTNCCSCAALRHSTISTMSPYAAVAESPEPQCARGSGLSQ